MPGFAGPPKRYSGPDYEYPETHAKAFTDFSSNIDLTQQTQTDLDGNLVDMPRRACSKLLLCENTNTAASFTLAMGARLPVVVVVPAGAGVVEYRGAWTAITSATGTAPRAVAFWSTDGGS